MEPNALVSSIGEKVTAGMNAKSVFGEPISMQGKTVIPVARIRFGFGGGSGAGTGGNSMAPGESGGGGGGGMAVPIGVVEITPEATRYVPFQSFGKLALAAAGGLIAGIWIGRRRARRCFQR